MKPTEGLGRICQTLENQQSGIQYRGEKVNYFAWKLPSSLKGTVSHDL
jgi:hypothetical protein